MKKKATPARDPAAIALERVMSARNDAEYDAAIAELETCLALTVQGIRAMRNLERLAALDKGDALTFDRAS